MHNKLQQFSITLKLWFSSLAQHVRNGVDKVHARICIRTFHNFLNLFLIRTFFNPSSS